MVGTRKWSNDGLLAFDRSLHDGGGGGGGGGSACARARSRGVVLISIYFHKARMNPRPSAPPPPNSPLAVLSWSSNRGRRKEEGSMAWQESHNMIFPSSHDRRPGEGRPLLLFSPSLPSPLSALLLLLSSASRTLFLSSD